MARLSSGYGGRDSLLRLLAHFFRIDPPLLLALLLLCATGLVALYSASGQDLDTVLRQGLRMAVAFGAMLLLAQVPSRSLRLWAPWVYAGGVALLIVVLVAGDVGKGAQRWLDLGVLRFQPSEILKIGLPLAMAWYLSERPLPPRLGRILVAVVVTAVPCVLIAYQPDLGTALLVCCSGLFALFLSGMHWRLLLGFVAIAAASTPVLWHFMHDYQRRRVLTFLNPESDPLGSGYHIIQSKIAIGSGGTYGKGWLNGTQSNLDFLPERSTDFVFAVYGEEFGFIGAVLLLLLYVFVVLRGLMFAVGAQDSFERILAGSLSLTFFFYLFVNIGMVTGLLPVVGVPLPLMSYGGTSMVTLMAGFGILMAINSHRRLLA
ncbi:MAG: rod shape-determining protein RodA [Gammaproteobacteria bacterium]|nr:rod shape-determining protein RodA [Gammaproteobacteria bacterium]